MPSRFSQGDVADLEWIFCLADGDVSGLRAAPLERAVGGTQYHDPNDMSLQLPHRRLAAARRLERLTRIRDRLFFVEARGAKHWGILRRVFGPRDHVGTPSLERATPTAQAHVLARAQAAERLRVLALVHKSLDARVRGGELSPMAAAERLLALDAKLVPTVDLELALDQFLARDMRRDPTLRATIRLEERQMRIAAEEAYVLARRDVDAHIKLTKAREPRRWLTQA